MSSRQALAASFVLASLLVGCEPKPASGEYVIMVHTALPASGDRPQEDDYTIGYGTEILKVKYAQSQTSSAKPEDFPGTGLHMHFAAKDPDLSQVPPAGVRIRSCLMDEERDKDGDLVIAHQPTPAPCMARVGSKLQYEPLPNAGSFTYVSFDIVSEKATDGGRN